MSIITLSGLTKKYGKNTVLDNFSMSVEKGHIHGLIGPNGAGKTTIMKIIAGLCAQTSGELSLFGQKEGLDKLRSRMSFMIEAPIIDPNMRAIENMEYIRRVKGIADKELSQKMLDYVGIGNTGKKLAKKFSLGMKQRLGIAMSLISSPEIMILDEPVNGLDPEGIVEIRNLLKKLAKEQGVTIIISSHLLTELSELCDDFTIMNKGKLIETLSASELAQKCRSFISLKTDDINKTCAVLEEKLSIFQYKVINDDEIQIYERLDELMLISKTITDNSLIITRLSSESESLEQYYLSKVGVENA